MRRTPEFDALRGLAALAIVVLHLWFPSFTPLSTALNLFFVLSGYLITGIILDKLDAENFLPAFFGRRMLRIWPIYYLALLAVVAFNAVSPVREPLDGLPYFLTYTQHAPAYWLGAMPDFIQGFKHTWTLAIEEQFYILWPVLIYLLGRRAVLPLTLTFLIAPIVARAAGFPLWTLLAQSDGLAFGALLALWKARSTASGQGGRLPEFTLLALLLAGVVYTVAGAALLGRLGGVWTPIAASTKVWFTNLFYFAFVALIQGRSGSPGLAPLRFGGLVYLGQVSYGIYLYHYLLIKTIEHMMNHYGVARSLAYDVLVLGATLGVAALSWRYVERPILAWKDRFDYQTRRRPIVAVNRTVPEPVARPAAGRIAAVPVEN